MKKIFFTALAVLILLGPSKTHAGFFDFFNIFKINQPAQVKFSLDIKPAEVGYKIGDKDEIIFDVQKALSEKGLYKGALSGLIGSRTQAAIMNWQKSNGLPTTGILTADTINSILGKEVKEEASVKNERGSGTAIYLNLKAMLSGPFDTSTNLMKTDLNDSGLIPSQEPYTSLGYEFIVGGGETLGSGALSGTGPDRVVDWVVVEIRPGDNPRNIVQSHALLIQADGDIVSTDGTSLFLLDDLDPNIDYFVSVRHRNHLGVMNQNPVSLLQSIDLTTVPLSLGAHNTVNGKNMMWFGDVNMDGVIKYTGVDNDRDLILQAIGGTVPTNTVSGYYNEDVNMDGVVKYAGANNDRDLILQAIGGTLPTNVLEDGIPDSYVGFIEINGSSSDPESRVIQVDDSNVTINETVFAFTLDVTGHDVSIQELAVSIDAVDFDNGGEWTDVDQFITSSKLYADGDLIGTESVVTTGLSDQIVLFDNLSETIDAYDEKDFEVSLDIQPMDGTDAENGDYVKLSVKPENIQAVISSGIGSGDQAYVVPNTKAGEKQAFYTEGIIPELISASHTVMPPTCGGCTNSILAEIEFNVTAFGSDIFIPAAMSIDLNNTDNIYGAGMTYYIDTFGSSVISSSGLLTSNAQNTTNGFRVDEGVTEMFQASILVQPSTVGFYKVEINSIEFAVTDVPAGDPLSQDFVLFEDFKTSNISINQ